MKNNTINSNAYAYLLLLLNKTTEVVRLTVRGKWLTADLSSGIKFSVKNDNNI